MTRTIPHKPVMLKEVLSWMAPQEGEMYLDATFGAGGYSRALLGAAACHLYALDRDPEVLVHAGQLKADYPDRFSFIRGVFSDMEALLENGGLQTLLDGIVLDVGVSSMQLDEGERGFSFLHDGPLDMRMSRQGVSASDIVNMFSGDDLETMFRIYGQERQARRASQAIVRQRDIEPITRTKQLADLLESSLKKPSKKTGKWIHPATRVFQALRIFINDELGELAKGLMAAERLLKPGGRLVVAAFHSLEDRLVKTFLKTRAEVGSSGSRYQPEKPEVKPPSFKLLSRRALVCSEEEREHNPRARSVRVRGGVRLAAPPHDEHPVFPVMSLRYGGSV